MSDAPAARSPTHLPQMTAALLRALWKERRDSYAEAHLYEDVRIRVHRSLTWMEKAESRGDADADTALIEWWAAASALFSRVSVVTQQPLADREASLSFSRQIIHWDRDGILAATLRTLAGEATAMWNDPYLTRAFGLGLKAVLTSEQAGGSETRAPSAAPLAAPPADGALRLAGILERAGLTVRQLTLGAASYGGAQNREAVARSRRALAALLPALLQVITEHGYVDDWGTLCSAPRA